jgi:branched-chain amino acid transport system permease protein
MILLGALAVLTMLRYPQGLWGLVAQRWDVHVFPVQRTADVATAPTRVRS